MTITKRNKGSVEVRRLYVIHGPKYFTPLKLKLILSPYTDKRKAVIEPMLTLGPLVQI